MSEAEVATPPDEACLEPSPGDEGTPAEPAETPDTRGWALLGVCVVLYLIGFAVWYPPTHAIEDEVGFLNTATIWAAGALTTDGAGLGELSETHQGPRGRVGWRNAGRSLLTAPVLAAFGYRATFAVGALIHVLLALVAGLALRRMGRSAAWALLLLWHPTFLLYSRAIMGDALGALCLCAAAWALLSKRYALAGLALGLAVVARYHLGAAIPVVVLTVLWASGRGPGLRVVLGGSAVGICLVAYNVLFFGSPLGATGQGHFSLGCLSTNVPHYASALLLVWPGMLLAPLGWGLWRWSRRGEHVSPEVDRRAAILGALSLPLFGILLAYYFFDGQGSSFPSRVVLGQRLLLPALPAWVLLYAQVLSQEFPGDVFGAARRRAWLAGVAPVFAILGVVGGGVVMARHQSYLEGLVVERERATAMIPPGSLVLANRHFSKLLEVPRPGLPSYRLLRYEYHGRLLEGARIQAGQEQAPYYLVHLRRRVDEPLPPAWSGLVARLGGETVLESPLLLIRRVTPRPKAPGGSR
ncbi:MAG: hypothetical protein JKY65_32790 [Planctomycetes bacterium]|nr:hypothetical protein [Planctomycetota bacterium]